MKPKHVAKPPHAAIRPFRVTDNELQLGGRSLTSLVAEAGRTPFYAYDRALMSQRLAALRTQLTPALKIHYAVKANPMPEVVRHFAAEADGLDVASGAELALALDTAVAPGEISFAGPGKTPAELEAAIVAGVILVAESAGELNRIAALARATGKRPQVALRVNPDFELKMAGMKMSGGPKPFGIDAEAIPATLAALPSDHLDVVGLHIFAGSQSLNADAIIDAQTKTFELATRLCDAAALTPRWLNVGGGLGIPYFPGEEPLELDGIARNLNRLATVAGQRFPGIELVVELGRFLVGEAGIYVCEIVDRKVSRGETFLVTNGGLHHHLSASGNFGQVIRRNYPVAIGNRMASAALETVNIVGPLCTPLDILAEKVELPATSVGDLVVVFQSGAYGYTASPLNFLSHPAPSEICL